MASLSILLVVVIGCNTEGNDAPEPTPNPTPNPPADPCEGVVCNEPPGPSCDGDEVVFYASEGHCEEGDCHYLEVSRLQCDDPPPAGCDGSDEVAFAQAGECRDGRCHYAEASRTACPEIAHICEPGLGVCIDPCDGVSCPPLDAWCEDHVLMMLVGSCDWRRAECAYQEVATDLPDCGFGYNFDFEQWTAGEPEGFVRHPSTDFRVLEESAEVNTGRRSARLESDTAEGRHLRASMPFEHLVPGEEYTFHFWYRFQGRSAGSAGAMLRPIIEISDGDGNVEPEWTVRGPQVTAGTEEWREVTVTTPPVAADRAFLRPLLEMRSEEGETTWATIDDFAVTMPITRNLNSRRDLDSLLFLFNGTYWVASGIDNRGHIYPTARSADGARGWDQILFTWVGRPSDVLVPAPWSKSGQVAGPGPDGVLFAVLQDPTGHCEWRRFDPRSGTWGLITGDSTCSYRVGDPAGLNYALEGVLDLVAHLDGVNSPEEIPTWFHFAASYWTTGAGGTLLPETQAPASRNHDGNIDARETHRAHRATFLSGKVTYYYP